MTIEAIKGPRGEEMARATCDECGKTLDVRAAHGNSNMKLRKGASGPRSANLYIESEGKVTTKLQSAGWAVVRGKHHCANCEAARKRPASAPVAVQGPTSQKSLASDVAFDGAASSASLRAPTPKQKREIIGMLELAYDDSAKRYKGTDTDKTVADAIGGGCLPGWVTEVREELFGPDGSNEEIEAILRDIAAARKEIAAVKERVDAVSGHAVKIIEEAIEKAAARTSRAEASIEAMSKRIDAIKACVGPKARVA